MDENNDKGRFPLQNQAEEQFCQDIAAGMKPADAYWKYSQAINKTPRTKPTNADLSNRANKKRKQPVVALRLAYLIDENRRESALGGITHAKLVCGMAKRLRELENIDFNTLTMREVSDLMRAQTVATECLMRLTGNTKPKEEAPIIKVEPVSPRPLPPKPLSI